MKKHRWLFQRINFFCNVVKNLHRVDYIDLAAAVGAAYHASMQIYRAVNVMEDIRKMLFLQFKLKLHRKHFKQFLHNAV